MEKPQTMEKSSGAKEEIFSTCSFSDLGLEITLCEHLQEKMAYGYPTQIQAKAIPVVVSGRDVLVNAATGTGKTIVYLAPIVHMLQMRNPRVHRSDGTFALVLVPTRELCMQVYEIMQKLSHRFVWIVPGYITGGENRAKEKARLRKGISVLIATPGRLLDHLKNTSSFSYSNLQWLVFDEADRILDLGFGKAIEEILGLLGSTRISTSCRDNKAENNRNVWRQHLLLSATLNEKVNQLANISLNNPVFIGLDGEKNHTELPSSSVIKLSPSKQDVIDGLEFPVLSNSHTVENYHLPSQLIQNYVKVDCGSRIVVLLSILKSLFERVASQKVSSTDCGFLFNLQYSGFSLFLDK